MSNRVEVQPVPAMPQWSERQSLTVVTALADLPGDSVIDAEALGRILNRYKKSVQRDVRRERHEL